MTKAELIKQLSKKTGLEKAIIEQTIESLMATIKEEVSNKHTVSFSSFGKFVPKRRAAKIARNISKNTPIELPAHFIPAFRPSKDFLDKVKRSIKVRELSH